MTRGIEDGGQRPSSRGGPGLGGPPGTGMRPMTGMRPGTGMRQGTARQGPVNMSGVGMTTNMSIAERPVTQQGLSGMRTAAGMGPQRQIQDNSFYLTQLRAKCTEIQKEIGVLKGTIEQGQKDNAAYGQLERKYETLTNEMRTLQGSLADYNLLLDRSRAQREVDEVLDEVQHLASANQADRGRVDEVFQHRSALEARARECESQLMRLHSELAEKLEAVDPKMKEHYLKLSAKHQALSTQELPKRQSEVAFLDERTREMEAALARDPYRAKAFRLREDFMRLERLQHSLSEELDGPQLSESEQREQLLQRVKSDNAAIAEMEKALTESQEKVRAGKKQLAQLANDASEANDPKAQKYQELAQRDKEMSELIDSFEPTKAIETAKIEAAQDEVVRLLQSISRRVAMTESPTDMTQDKLDEMASDLSFKRSQMDHSVSTSERLQHELQQRKVELEKIETLDEKISTELEQLETKLQKMTADEATYDDLPKLRTDADESAAVAMRRKEVALGSIDQLKQKAAKCKKVHDDLKKQLANDDVAVALEELEAKMRHHEQTVYVLTEYIETKGAESHFEGLAEECHHMMQQINQEAIRAVSERPVFNPASLY